MKVSLPRFTFLSCAMWLISVSASMPPPGICAIRVGRPTSARWAATRLPSSGVQWPSFAERPKASTMPIATRLAVEQAVGIAGGGFERMAEGVAEIEEGADAALALVGGDDRGLGAAGDGDGVLALRPAGGDRAPVGLEPGEEIGRRRSARTSPPRRSRR